MLISKYIQIDFADSRIKAIDAIHDIRKAAESAGLNLFSRYDVQLQYPMPSGGDKVVVEVKIPEEIINTFSIGNHLRGISAYLLKYCNGKYDQYQVGKRLLNYTEISEPTGNPDGPTMTERSFLKKRNSAGANPEERTYHDKSERTVKQCQR